MTPSKKYLAIPLLLLSLTSCAMISGRETPGQYVDDAAITAKVKNAFIVDPQVKAMQVNVETMQGVVQLSGFVESTKAEQRAVELARNVKGVKAVKNDMIIRPHRDRSDDEGYNYRRYDDRKDYPRQSRSE